MISFKDFFSFKKNRFFWLNIGNGTVIAGSFLGNVQPLNFISPKILKMSSCPLRFRAESKLLQILELFFKRRNVDFFRRVGVQRVVGNDGVHKPVACSDNLVVNAKGF